LLHGAAAAAAAAAVISYYDFVILMGGWEGKNVFSDRYFLKNHRTGGGGRASDGVDE